MTKVRFSILLFLIFLLGWTLPGFAADTEKKGQTMLNLGVFAYESGDYETAETHLKKALTFVSEDAYINYYLGRLYLDTADYPQAAIYLDKARSTGEDLPDLAYYWAYVNYKLENYAQAETLFDELVAAEPGNALARFYAGLAAFEQENYQKALQLLNETAQMETSIRYNAEYYAGVCYLHLQRFEKAKERFIRVQQNAEHNVLCRAAADFLEGIRRLERETRRYSLVAKAGWEYDDNEVLEPIDNNDLYADEEDNIFSAYVSGSYNIIQTDKFVMGAGYSHYATFHEKFKKFDLSGSLFDVYARYRLEDYTFSVSYNPDYYWLDSDSYLCRHEVKTTVSRQFENILAELSYNHQRDNNIYDANQDGYANEIFFRCRYSFPEELGSLRAGAGYEKNVADHDDYDYDIVTTELAARFNLLWGFSCAFSGECEMKKYEHPNSAYQKLRDDTQYTGNILLSWNALDERISTNIGYEYTKNNSNIDDTQKYAENHEYESNAVKVFWTVQI